MDLAYYHPIVVHFAIALSIVGVAFRLLSLVKRFSPLGPAAFLLILTGTLASTAAVKSGGDAHGPVERMPGAREAVQEHEEWGERARNAFFVVLAIEIAALLLRRNKYRRAILALSGVAGAVALFPLFEAAEHGGDLVYEYAGGIGIRSGDAADVERLLLAGLYQRAQLARHEEKPEEAARLYRTLKENFPKNPDVELAFADSLLRDSNSPEQALAELDQASDLLSGDTRRELQASFLRANVLARLDRIDEARAILKALSEKYPENRRIQRSFEEFNAKYP